MVVPDRVEQSHQDGSGIWGTEHFGSSRSSKIMAGGYLKRHLVLTKVTDEKGPHSTMSDSTSVVSKTRRAKYKVAAANPRDLKVKGCNGIALPDAARMQEQNRMMGVKGHYL